MEMTAPVEELKGVGAKTAEILRKYGIRTVRDFIYNLPRDEGARGATFWQSWRNRQMAGRAFWQGGSLAVSKISANQEKLSPQIWKNLSFFKSREPRNLGSFAG